MKYMNRMLCLLIAAAFAVTSAVPAVAQTITGSVDDLGKAKEIIGGIDDETDEAVDSFEAVPEEEPAVAELEETAVEEAAPDTEENSDAEEDIESETEGETVEDAASEESIPEGDARITVKFDNEPFQNAVRLLMELSGANIIAPQANTNALTVTANLQNVPWREAAEAILSGNGYGIREVTPGSDIWVIEAVKPGAPAPWMTETFKLQYVKANDAMRMLQSMLGIGVDDKSKASTKNQSQKKTEDDVVKEDVEVIFREDGRLASVPEANMIIVSSPVKKMEEIRKVLLAIDVPRQQVFVEAKIVQIQGDASRNIGLDWSSLDQALGLTIGPFQKAYSRTKLTGKTGNSKSLSSAVYSDGVVNEFTSASGRSLSRNSSLAISGSAETSGGKTVDKTTAISDIRTLSLDFAEMSAVLHFLEANDDAKLVSNPKMIVANEEAAVIDMSRKEPYVSIEKQQDGTGSEATYTWTTELEIIPGENDDLPYIEQAFFSYGIRLKVVPRVNNESNITVMIEPTISKLHEYYTPGDESLTRYPIIDSKRVKTTFSLSDGATAVIGGLTETEDSEVVKKVPFLGDIPFIGKWLFTNTKTEKIVKETVIFVTIGIVDEATHPGRALKMPEATKLMYDHVNKDGSLKSAVDVERSKRISKSIEKQEKKQMKQDALVSGEALIPMSDEPADNYYYEDSLDETAESVEAAGSQETSDADKIHQLQMGELLEPM